MTNNIADRLTYMKGLDVSYHIEGYNAYKAEELLMCRAQLYHFGYTIIIKISNELGAVALLARFRLSKKIAERRPFLI